MQHQNIGIVFLKILINARRSTLSRPIKIWISPSTLTHYFHNNNTGRAIKIRALV